MNPGEKYVLTQEEKDAVEAVCEGWYPAGTRMDLEDFLDRVENYGVDVGDSLISPNVKAIQAYAREYRKATS